MQSSSFKIFLGIGLLLTSLSVNAQSWKGSFTLERVKTYIKNQDKIMIVAAGEEDIELERATKTLIKAARKTGVAGLVMDNSPVGDVSNLSDREIIKKAKDLGVNKIFVVRYFEPQIVITIYDRKGKSIGGITAEKGVPIASGSIHHSSSDGVDGNAAGAVSDVVSEIENSSQEYEDKYIGYQGWVGINQYGQTVATGGYYYLGKNKKPLGLLEIFQVLERQDLIDYYKEKKKLRMILGATGGGIALIGISFYIAAGVQGVKVYDFRSSSESEFESEYGYEDPVPADDGKAKKAETKRNAYLAVGTVLTVSGAAIATAGLFIRKTKLSNDEVRNLIDKHNKKLKRDFGISKMQKKTDFEWNTSPYFTYGGGGMILSMSF
jgi:hypothetical protein